MNNTFEYKGYFTNIHFSAEDNLFYGKIEGIEDLVTFESKTNSEIGNEFKKAVDDYLSYIKMIKE